jgi:hypothetical protein
MGSGYQRLAQEFAGVLGLAVLSLVAGLCSID